MNTLTIKLKSNIFVILADFAVLALLYLVPTFSHMLAYPVYLFEPMRILLFISLALTNKKNGYFLAFTLPLFSFFLSGHPFFIKSILISCELSINVYLFYLLTKFFKQKALSLALSVFFSKIIYYLGKFLLIKALLIKGDLISTPVTFQIMVVFLVPILYMLSKFLKEKMGLFFNKNNN